MAIDFDNSLDEQAAPDGQTDFSGGQYSSTAPHRIPPNCYAYGENVDIDPLGRIVTRRGEVAASPSWNGSLSALPIHAAFYFDTYAAEYMIAAQNGTLYQASYGFAFASIASSSYSGDLVYFAQLNNRLYYCDGVGALKYISSALAHSSITAGKVSSITPVEQGVGYVAVPTVTFSSGGAAATAVLGYGGRVIGYTVTTPSSGYSATTPPSATLTAAPAGGVTATCRVNISQVPSKPKYLTTHKNRLFCCSNDTTIPPDTIYVSDILDGESWDLVGGSIRIGGDGDAITGIYSWFDNNLLVFKQRSVWMINTDPLLNVADWQISVVNSLIGCVGHKTIQSVGPDVFFLAPDGVRSVAQIQAGSQSAIALPLSEPIKDIIQEINMELAPYIRSVKYGQRYILSVPYSLDGKTCDKTMVWDGLRKAWLGAWYGWNVRDYIITGFSGDTRLTFADHLGKFWVWDDFTSIANETVNQYKNTAGSAYAPVLVSRAYLHGNPLVKKLGQNLQVITDNTLPTDTIATFSYMLDEGVYGVDNVSLSSQPSTTPADTSFYPFAWNMIPKGKYRTIQFCAVGQYRMAISAIAVTAYLDTLVPEINP